MGKLKGRRMVFLIADMTHDEELNFPRYWLLWEGAEVILVGLKEEHTSKFGRPLKADITVRQLEGLGSIDAVIIPGGFGPDYLRADDTVLKFVKKHFEEGKLIAAICHGPQVLVSAGIVKGRKLTCVKNVVTDVVNAEGEYVDEPVVRDGNLITSRRPFDLPGFTSAIIEALS